MRSHSSVKVKSMKNCWVLNVLYGLPNDDSLGIGICNTVEWDLLNDVMFDWCVFIFIDIQVFFISTSYIAVVFLFVSICQFRMQPLCPVHNFKTAISVEYQHFRSTGHIPTSWVLVRRKLSKEFLFLGLDWQQIMKSCNGLCSCQWDYCAVESM